MTEDKENTSLMHSIKKAKEKGYRFYCYCLIDPRDNSIFYIGKGTKNRILQHEKDVIKGRIQNPAKTVKVREILNECGYLRKQIIAFSKNECDAFDVERLHIQLYGYQLTNSQSPRINKIEQSKQEAKYCLSRVIPINVWIRLRNPSENEIKLYNWVIEKLKRMSEFGAEDQFLITNNEIIQLR